MGDRDRNVIQYIGDFYQARLRGDELARKEALDRIEYLVNSGEADGTPFVEYYNDILSGRSGFNAKLNIADYPKESMIREILQNAFGCHYVSPDIKIVVDFQEDDVMTVSYNEVGFSLEDILYYFSFGINTGGDDSREGRFGIGAKSVFLNVEYMAMRSNSFGFKIVNRNGSISIDSFELKGKEFRGTMMTLKLAHDEYERIKDNLLTLTEKKGDYINLVELCFAFNRKKVMNRSEGEEESFDRTFNVAVSQQGQVTDVYRISLNRKNENDTPKIRFHHNNKSLVDFLYYENEGFVYLVPFAVANTKRRLIIQLLLEKYNYFSTYELTGYIGAGKDKIVNEKLSAFFVSVPNSCITNTRTGIRFDREVMVYDALERDIPAILKTYGECFILDLKPTKSGGYTFTPRSYAFEFFNSFLKTSRYGDKVRDVFISGISVIFPGEKEPKPYDRLRKNGLKSVVRGVPKSRKDDGTAEEEYILHKLETLKSRLPDREEAAIYAGFEWEDGNTEKSGRVYRYEIVHGGKSYTVNSQESGTQDYELYSGFPSLVDFFLPSLLTQDCVADENDLEKIFSLFDEAAGEDYTLSMKYYRIHYDRDGESSSFEISRIKIRNVKNAMDTLEKRSRHFVNNQNYTEVVALLMNSFTEGKDTMTFLREIKQQGGVISLTLDFNNRYRLSAYGRQFMIPSSVTNTDLMEILGDLSQFLDSGLLKGRKFDFSYSTSRYVFDQEMVAQLLLSYASVQETKDIMNSTVVVNLKYDGVAFLTADDKVVCIKRYGEPVSEEDRSSAKRYVILRDDLSKTEFASMLEYIIAGSDLGILKRFFNRTKDPNRIIPDQIPLKYRRAPVLSRGEFDFAMELYDSIKKESDLPNYKSYFAKDVNARLYGYGTYCSCCGENGYDINAYDLADFSADIMIDGVEKHFNFAMYLCRNHISDSNGWFIKELTVGGMDPFKWMEELSDAQEVPPEFFLGTLKYVPHLVYGITPDASSSSDVVSAEPQTLYFRLTPLMAAKWFKDNKRG